MEFLKNNLSVDMTDEYFSNIENSEFKEMSPEDKILMIETIITNSIKDCDTVSKLRFFEQVVVNLIKKSIDHENMIVRQFGIYLTLASIQLGKEYFEPYLNQIMPELLNLFADKHRDIINISLEVLPKVFQNLSCYSLNDMLDLFKERITDKSWKLSIGCLKLVSVLANTSPKQIDYILPELVPLITSQAGSTKKELREQTTETLNSCCKRISNPDVIPLIPKLVMANKDPKQAPMAIEALMETTFVNQVEISTLAVIVPILNRGLKDRNSKLQRSCCLVIDNMCRLVNDSKDVKPFEKDLLPYITRIKDEASRPEVREMAEKAVNTLTKALSM